MRKPEKSRSPSNWPSSLPYLRSPIYSPSLTQAHLTAIRTPSEALPSFPSSLLAGPHTNVRITPITDPAHPAYKQAGLFATRDLAPGELAVPYLGEYHPSATTDLTSDYDLWLDKSADVAVDAARMGNEARFVNDYRGVPGRDGKRQNAEFKEVWWAGKDGKGEKGMAVFVLPAGKRAVGRAKTVGIAKGEEILVSYGKGFWDQRRDEEAGMEAGQL
ncbi:hypothetical protein DL546_007091 [Coniochaeta pulveracea]|uniref:SET domain-containing protein n=1 Tax=Coniochaeta pulveracea TaxID=177199 RepID=A0A420YAI3_9PEZI|nr:hypothetical protein DL546_007091 [Coniochaeta pulveracea]